MLKIEMMYRNILLITLLLLSSCSQSDNEYFPLDAGKYWRYQMIYQTMDGRFKGVYAVENLPQQEIEGQTYYVRQLLDGSLNYLQVDDRGIRLKRREKTVDLDTKYTETEQYIFHFPLQEGTTWEDTILSKALIKTGPPQKTEFHIVAKVPVSAKIESMNDVVEVPAGRFENCMRIVMSGNAFIDAGNYVGKTIVRVNETNWYAPGVGLVKSVRQESTKHRALDKGEIILELENYRF
jgi:hypothetical protein